MKIYSVYIDDNRVQLDLDVDDSPNFDVKEVVLGALASGVKFKKRNLKGYDTRFITQTLTTIFNGYAIDIFHGRSYVDIIITDNGKGYLFEGITDWCILKEIYLYFSSPELSFEKGLVASQILPEKVPNAFVYGSRFESEHKDWRRAFSLLKEADKTRFSVFDMKFRNPENGIVGLNQRMFGVTMNEKHIFAGYTGAKNSGTQEFSYEVFLGVCRKDGAGVLFVLDSNEKEGYLVFRQVERIETAVMANKQKELKSFVEDVLY